MLDSDLSAMRVLMQRKRRLTQMPLVEAIFELHWVPTLANPTQGPPIDPGYQLLSGRFFDRVKANYPAFEPAPSPWPVPGALVLNAPLYRFRTGPGQWPLVQLGHGILTVNDVAGYSWHAFRPRVLEAVGSLLESHPNPTNIRTDQLQLRYIDAWPFDFRDSDIYAFLRSKMGLSIEVPKPLSDNADLGERPSSFSWQTVSNSRRPHGLATLTFSAGEKENRPHLFWEVAITTNGADVPDVASQLGVWLDEAHNLAVNGIFWRLIQGELEKEFGVVYDD